ncbi:hypothetical protein ABK040_005381 [Willaertia magna]
MSQQLPFTVISKGRYVAEFVPLQIVVPEEIIQNNHVQTQELAESCQKIAKELDDLYVPIARRRRISNYLLIGAIVFPVIAIPALIYIIWDVYDDLHKRPQRREEERKKLDQLIAEENRKYDQRGIELILNATISPAGGYNQPMETWELQVITSSRLLDPQYHNVNLYETTNNVTLSEGMAFNPKAPNALVNNFGVSPIEFEHCVKQLNQESAKFIQHMRSTVDIPYIWSLIITGIITLLLSFFIIFPAYLIHYYIAQKKKYEELKEAYKRIISDENVKLQSKNLQLQLDMPEIKNFLARQEVATLRVIKL